MLQAMAVLLRKRAELTRELEAGLRNTVDIESELKALDQAIAFMRQSEPSGPKRPRNPH